MKCNFCGNNLLGNEKYCPNCGTKVPQETIVVDEDAKVIESKRSNSIVLGIIAFVGVFFGLFAPISIILSIIGLVLAVKANRHISNPAGIILNIVSLILSIIITAVICLVIYFGIFAVNRGVDSIRNYNERTYERY